MQSDFKADVIGDSSKLREVFGILESACKDVGGSICMGELLSEHNFPIEDYPEFVMERDCHYLGLLAVLLCKDITTTRMSFELLGTSFLSGVELDEDKLTLYFYGQSNEADFFDSLLTTSDYVSDYELFNEEEEVEIESEADPDSWNPDKDEDSDVTGELIGW